MYNYCIIHDKEMTSICCGAHPVAECYDFCGHCRDHAEFECEECVDEKEEAAKHWLDTMMEKDAIDKTALMTETEEILRASFWADPEFVKATAEGFAALDAGDSITLDELRKEIDQQEEDK